MSEGRVLVVDDEADVRKSVRLILSKAGYEVVEGEDGEAGVRTIKRGDNPFALGTIICDLNMPKMNGMEAITYFRSHFPHASVIVLSDEVTSKRAEGSPRARRVQHLVEADQSRQTCWQPRKRRLKQGDSKTSLRHDGNISDDHPMSSGHVIVRRN